MGEYNFAARMAGLNENVIREIFKIAQMPDIISFAGGLPSPDSFPIEEIKEITAKILEQNGSKILQYGVTEGYNPLREFIVSWVKRYSIDTEVDNVLVVSGSSQGIDLAAKSFINPGDYVLVENPTFLSAIQTFKGYQARIVPVEMDEDGIIPEDLELKISEFKPKLLYTIPHYQNPTGITLSEERRERVMNIINRSNVIVLEDDPYVELRYYADIRCKGERLPALKSMDKNNQVIYLGSFSKIVSPGLRVGYAIADKEILRRMIICKQANDLHTPTLSQVIVHEFATTNLIRHIRNINEDYSKKRNFMIEMLEKHMKKKAVWTEPDGGLFLWLTIDSNVKTSELLKTAVENKVAFIPGFPFYAEDGGENTMRLNFSNASLKDIEIGIERLAQIV
ncbi:MAG: PLP-dependent aminotransferase family protein [Ignavibacteriales bacterium]